MVDVSDAVATRFFARCAADWKAMDSWLRIPQITSIDAFARETSAPGDNLSAVAQVTRTRVAASEPSALWGALDTTRLTLLAAGVERSIGLDRVVGSVKDGIQAESSVVQAESTISISWPSRAGWGVPLFLKHGFRALSVLSIAAVGEETPQAEVAGLHIRSARPDDIAVLVALWVRLVDYESAYGAVFRRENAREILESALQEAFAEASGWIWLAELYGMPVGFLKGTAPFRTTWAGSRTSGGPKAYVDALWVDEGARRLGIGGQLFRRHAERAAAAGAEATMLHYSKNNPLSGRFWVGRGFRPLYTTWRCLPLD